VGQIGVKGICEIIEATGSDKLEHLVIRNIHTKECEAVGADALYIFIGAKPYSEWLGTEIVKNDKGFIKTERELSGYDDFGKVWKVDRYPFLLETSCSGIFADSDVRAEAMNRVASAVGEGSMSISLVHKYLVEV
jgi:thioredoxin reductase (NADPH)